MTLVELMVTMVIASIVAASTFMFFAGQQRVYETQTKMLNVQQNAWAAMEVLTRFVRAAGSGMYGCVRPVGGIVVAPPLTRTPAATVDDSDDPPVAPPNTVHNLSVRPSAGLRAYNAATGQMQRIPPLWIVDQEDGTDTGIVAGTDVITVAFGNKTSGTTFDSPLAGIGVVSVASNVTIPLPSGNAAMFQPNEFIVLVGEPGMGGNASDIGCTLLQVTSSSASDPNNNFLVHAQNSWNPASNIPAMIPGTTGYGAFAPDQNLNTGVRNFGEFWWVRFAIRTKDANGNYLSNPGKCVSTGGSTHDIPVLTMERLDGTAATTGPQVLAEGIEDLQVAFACDLDANGRLIATNDQNTDEWKLDPNDTTIMLTRGAKCNQPSAIRLTLLARSLTEDNGINASLTDNGRPAVENHAAHAQNPYPACTDDLNDPNWNSSNFQDQFRRRVLTTTVYPRNN
jgi:type II secretory pathway pseudopilin PulG